MNSKLYILAILVLSLAVYYRWINFSIFTYSDISYTFSETLYGYLNPSVWTSSANLGNVDTLIWRVPFYLMLGFVGSLGYGSNVAEKLLYFWPIIIFGGLSSFLLIRKVFKDDLAAFIGSLVFTYNTYFLSINTQGHHLLTLAFIFAVLALYFYIKYLENNFYILAILTTLFLFITGFYDLRALYIITGILILYLFYFIFFIPGKGKSPFLRQFLIYILPFILLTPLTFYWILPTVMGGSFISNENFGRLISYSEFYKLTHAITLHFPFWTGIVPRWDTFINIPWYFWLFPVMAIMGLIINRKRPVVLFFGLVSAIGILLTKQIDVPFDNLYIWLYRFVPGFNAFREASKFYFLIVLGYSVLIGSLISSRRGITGEGFIKKYALQLFVIGAVILSLWNSKSLITGEIGTLFIPKKLPVDMIRTKNFIFNQSNYFRTAWIHPPVRWILASNDHPLINMNTFVFDIANSQSTKSFDSKIQSGKYTLMNIEDNRMDRMLDFASVKYVMVLKDDKETTDLIYKSIGISGEEVENSLESINYLKRVDIGTKDILVYENKGFRPHIYSTTKREGLDIDVEYNPVSFETISPSEYKLTLNDIDKPTYIHFTDAYHPKWTIKAGKFNWFSSVVNKEYFLADKYHTKSIAGSNTFFINPDSFCSLSNCVKSDDGKYDITLTIFFRPQAYLLLGMYITALTLLSLIMTTVYIIIIKYKVYAQKD